MTKEDFKSSHRDSSRSFTRQRKLGFTSVMILILQKSMKSIQLLLNEMSLSLENFGSVTASAFTQARSHLKHTAFIELNQKAIVDVMYSDDTFETYKGLRLLAVDGSKIILPNTPEIQKEFGSPSYRVTNAEDEIMGGYAASLCSVCYDVLNHIVLDATLAPIYSYEGDLALKHLTQATQSDLYIYDRAYPSYNLIFAHVSQDTFFLMRCPSAFFKEVNEMFHGTGEESKIITLSRPQKLKHTPTLPPTLKVRVLRVILPTGEPEVLITNLFDETEFPTRTFLTIYNLRWGIETFYGLLKTRLTLENFSGKTVESVYQDFYGTIYLCGLETILTQDLSEELALKETFNIQQVNHAVSFNAIKNKAFDLLLHEKNQDKLLKQLEALFRMNPVQYRSHRQVPRKQTSVTNKLNHQKRRKKICY